MKETEKHQNITPDSFERMLNWLDSDPNGAGNKFETIRVGLIKIFAWRRCSNPEELADETIGRVIANVNELAPNYVGDPARYFYGVARKVAIEYFRRSGREVALGDQQTVFAIRRKPAHPRPPFNAEYVLYFLLGSEERSVLIGDLIEDYGKVLERFNKRRADIWFYKQVVGSLLPLLRRALLRIGALVWLGQVLRRLIS